MYSFCSVLFCIFVQFCNKYVIGLRSVIAAGVVARQWSKVGGQLLQMFRKISRRVCGTPGTVMTTFTPRITQGRDIARSYPYRLY